MAPDAERPILTLEPLVDAVREGVEDRGWELSGLQKTTSHQFEGRWEGDSTRSAYLFFHRTGLIDAVSIDAYLDETSRGLTGNVALVVDLEPLGALPQADALLERMRAAAARALDSRFRRPITLRFRLPDAGTEATDAETEVRFKVRLPSSAVQGGYGAVVSWAAVVVEALDRVIGDSEVRAFLSDD